VFFGRLEHRKGLHLFCDAIDKLLDQGCAVPPVTFLGKAGAPIPSDPTLTPEQYIAARAQDWPIEWRVETGLGQADALRYLRDRDRLAVMPSLAENSPLTVYEATQHGIPFVATDVGGTSELIASSHTGHVLCQPSAASSIRLRNGRSCS